jgi:ABC-type dipeptide/oligopeptide/nickel transport system ATPase component
MRSTRSWPAGDEMTAAAIMEAGARRVELNRPETAAAPVLSVSNLSVAFETERGRVAAVRDVSFNLYAGRTLALVGESGSGKSVTSLSIMRLLGSAGVIAAGSITLATPTGPQDLLRLRESEMRGIRGRSISMIFQEPMTSLNPVLTVGHQIA